MKNAGFPDKPETLGDLSDQQKEGLDYVPGRDTVYEEAVEVERKAVEEDNEEEVIHSDEDISVIGHQPDSISPPVSPVQDTTTPVDDITDAMSRTQIDDSAVSKAILRPIWTVRTVPDPIKELLGIVEGIKAFDNILQGQKIVVHTDHLNLLYTKLASQRLVQWRLLLEEYAPEVRHVNGEKNVVADALSRLDMEERDFDTLPNQQLEYRYDLVRVDDIEETGFPMAP